MLTIINKEWRNFLLALGFFTRIPVPSFPDFKESDLNGATQYFPFIGIIVGIVGAAVFSISIRFLPLNIAVLISMASTIYLTGAFHEDGLADSADGLGGGWQREQILTIMQDSRLGTYGATALFLILITKFELLIALPVDSIPAVLIASHATSRLSAVYLMACLNYVKATGKAKPLAKKVSLNGLAIATLFGVSPVVILCWQFKPLMLSAKVWWIFLLCLLIPMLITWVWWRNKLKKWLGGYTGDCLGAMQQICELSFYFGLVVWSHGLWSSVI